MSLNLSTVSFEIAGYLVFTALSVLSWESLYSQPHVLLRLIYLCCNVMVSVLVMSAIRVSSNHLQRMKELSLTKEDQTLFICLYFSFRKINKFQWK